MKGGGSKVASQSEAGNQGGRPTGWPTLRSAEGCSSGCRCNRKTRLPASMPRTTGAPTPECSHLTKTEACPEDSSSICCSLACRQAQVLHGVRSHVDATLGGHRRGCSWIQQLSARRRRQSNSRYAYLGLSTGLPLPAPPALTLIFSISRCRCCTRSSRLRILSATFCCFSLSPLVAA